MEWKAQSVRLTAFLSTQIGGRGIFQKIFGAEPDVSNEKPREGLLLETGVHAGRRVALSVNPGRAQLELLVPELEESPFAVIAAAHQAVFQDTAAVGRKWLEALPNTGALVRLAFGATLLCEQQNKSSAYTALKPLLPALSIDPAASDLVYRINRPRPSKVLGGLQLNRLSTWTVAELHQMVLLGHARQQQGFVVMATAARLELDVNTDALRIEALPAESLNALLDELVATGVEIAAQGDRP